jgi:hypothetical protein
MPTRIKIPLLCLIVALLTYASRHFMIDDALIMARYVQNAVNGNGLVFNRSEYVNALTSPLFSYVLVGVSWLLQGNVLLAEYVLCGICLLGAVLLAERMVSYSGFLIASTAYFYYHVGMETSLFMFMLMLTITLYFESRLDWLPLALLLLGLTRFEGAAMIPVIAWNLYRTRSFPRLPSFIAPIGIGLAYLLFNHHVYGLYLPSSGLAKLGQGMSGYWGPWPFSFLLRSTIILRVFPWAFYKAPIIAILFVIGVFASKKLGLNRVILPFLAILLSFYMLFNLPNYTWYYAPFIFFGMFYAVLAVKLTRFRYPILVAAMVLQISTNTLWLSLQNTNQYYNYCDVGRWLDANTPKKATVAVCESGIIGWYSHRYIIDILGLTTPKNAGYIAHRDATSWLAEDHPDYIVMHHPTWWWEEVADASPDYQDLPVHFGPDSSTIIRILQRKTVDATFPGQSR